MMEVKWLNIVLLLFLGNICTFSESQLLGILTNNDNDTPTPDFVYKSYQGGIYCNASSEIQKPKTVEEIRAIVQGAISSGKTVKALGSVHSLSDAICTDGIPICMKCIKYKIDNGNDTATFGAGTELLDALTFLEERGKTLIHVPAYAGITIGGSIGTGAHGSSLKHTPTISDQVVGVTIVDGLGNIRQITDAEELKAFRVHLGLLGILVDVTVRTVPLFKMRVENSVESETVLFHGTALSWARDYDWFQIWWFPSYDEVVVSKGNYTDVSVPGNARTNMIPDLEPAVVTTSSTAFETLQLTRAGVAEAALEKYTELSLYTTVVGKPPIFTENGVTVSNPATGYAWRLQANKCSNICSWENGNTSIFPEESSMAFELSDANFVGVFTEMKAILQQYPAQFHLIGAFIRFSKASDALMAISSGRDTFTVEWTTPRRTNPFDTARNGIGAYQAILQSMVSNFGGRSHWGKNGLYYTNKDFVRASYPKRDAFIAAMRNYDPNGIFLNKFGRRVLGLSNAQDRDPAVTRCALQDFCICQKASDCAPLQSCVKVKGFNVCRDLISINPPLNFNLVDLKNLTQILQIVNGLL